MPMNLDNIDLGTEGELLKTLGSSHRLDPLSERLAKVQFRGAGVVGSLSFRAYLL